MLEAMSRVLGMMFIGVSAALAACAAGPRQESLQADLRAAQDTLTDLGNDPAIRPMLRENMENAKAIMIVTPRVTRAVAVAHDDKTRKWSAPAFYHLTNMEAAGGRTAGMGFTAGEQNLELVAMAMTDRALNWLLVPTLPGSSGLGIVEATGASGGAPARADVLLFSSSPVTRNGVRAGELARTIVTIDKAANAAYYGQPATPADILVNRSVDNPNAESLRTAVAATGKRE